VAPFRDNDGQTESSHIYPSYLDRVSALRYSRDLYFRRWNEASKGKEGGKDAEQLEYIAAFSGFLCSTELSVIESKNRRGE